MPMPSAEVGRTRTRDRSRLAQVRHWRWCLCFAIAAKLNCSSPSSSLSSCDAFAFRPRRSTRHQRSFDGSSTSSSSSSSSSSASSVSSSVVVVVAPSMVASDDLFSRRTARDWEDQRTGVGRSVSSYYATETETTETPDHWRREDLDDDGDERGQRRRQRFVAVRPVVATPSFLNNDGHFDRGSGVVDTAAAGGGGGGGERTTSSWDVGRRRQRAYRNEKFARDPRWPQQSWSPARTTTTRKDDDFGGRDYYERRRRNQILTNGNGIGGRGDAGSVREGSGGGGIRGRKAHDGGGGSDRRGGNYYRDAPPPVSSSPPLPSSPRGYYREDRSPSPPPREYGTRVGFEERRQQEESHGSGVVRNDDGNYDPAPRRGGQWRGRHGTGAPPREDNPFVGGGYSVDDPPPPSDPVRYSDRQFGRVGAKISNAIEPPPPRHYEAESGQIKDPYSYYPNGPKTPQSEERYWTTTPSSASVEGPDPTSRTTQRIIDYYPRPRPPPSSPNRVRTMGNSGYYDTPGDRVPVRNAPSRDERPEQAKSTGVGYGGIEKFANSFLYPFGTASSRRKRKGKGKGGSAEFSSGVKRMLERERRAIEELAKDARARLLSDPEVRDALSLGEEGGEDEDDDVVRLGIPFSRSSFSNRSAVDGERTATSSYGLRLGMPIVVGADGVAAGGVWLTADEGGIVRLEVIAGGREIEVRVDKPRRRGVVDAQRLF